MIVLYVALAALALGLCLAAAPLGRFLGVVDVPDGRRKTHSRETPLVGGTATVLPVLAMAVVLASTTSFAPLYASLAVILALFLLLGLVDDRRHIRLRPLWRLGISVAASIAVLVAVPGLELTFLKFSFLTNTIFLGGFGLAFTVLCLVGLQNAINMADGKNGLVIGLVLIWTVGLLHFAPAHVEPVLIAFALGLAIALPFNLSGRLFLGDSGTYAISILVGVLTLYAYNVNFAALPADLVALWFSHSDRRLLAPHGGAHDRGPLALFVRSPPSPPHTLEPLAAADRLAGLSRPGWRALRARPGANRPDLDLGHPCAGELRRDHRPRPLAFGTQPPDHTLATI